MKILIAEDEPDMQKILSLYLEKEGYGVAVVSNGEEAMDYLEENSVDLLLLDWMMPIKNGLEVCREVRLLEIPVKILMLTAKSENEHEFLGLSRGADDYLRKPFDMKILLLRIKKLCRQEKIMRCGRLSLNQEAFEVYEGKRRVSLTRKEFDLLCFLMQNERLTLTREQILNHVWGMDYEGEMRTVDTHIRRLRAKIEVEYIQTNVGTGYRLEVSDEQID